MIRVVRGNPTPEELAAALAVVRARAAASASTTEGSAPPPPEGWSDPARIARTRRPLLGPRAWARSYWPV
ncbi:acyl-CoA carboxylase epsilon subunit [Streptomyces sp. CA-135486]|uniref:acyl-CoA carboxylase epsilon subunit n=1 Tax=Streptomyces sp. CA-135486 TaxID=3240049 RepID=UPI003D8EDF7D